MADFDVQIKANGTLIGVLSRGRYFTYPVSAGTVRFSADSYLQTDNYSGETKEVKAWHPRDATIEVKPGLVYHLSLRILPIPFWNCALYQLPHEEGDNLLKGGELSAVK